MALINRKRGTAGAENVSTVPGSRFPVYADSAVAGWSCSWDASLALRLADIACRNQVRAPDLSLVATHDVDETAYYESP